MNTQNRPEATTHGGRRRLHNKTGHSNIIVSSVALAFCLVLLTFSVIGMLASTQKTYASSDLCIKPIPRCTPTATPTTGITPTLTATTGITPTITVTTGITPTVTPTTGITPTATATTSITPTATTPPGVTPTATPTNTPGAAGGAPPPPPTQNAGASTPTPPSNGGTAPGNGPATAAPTSGSNDQGSGNTHTNVTVNGNTGVSGSTTDSTGIIVGASAGVVLLLIVAGLGGWMLYNRRMDQQARGNGYPAAISAAQGNQPNWNTFSALEGTANSAPTMMSPPPSFGIQDNMPLTPPPNYNGFNQSAMEAAGQYGESLPTTPAHGFTMSSEGGQMSAAEANYAAYHNEYATMQGHTPFDEQLLFAQDDGLQPPETPLPTGSTETYLDEMMHQAQIGLFVLPDRAAE